MYTKMLVLLLLMINVATFAQTGKDPIIGKWINESDSRVLEFVQKGSGFDAIIRKAKDPSYIGKTQISGLQPKGSNTYSSGTVYIISRGKTASCSAKLINKDVMQLIGKMGSFSRTQEWKRVKE